MTLLVTALLGVPVTGQYDDPSEFQYVLTEEQDIDSVVADLVSDAGLHQTLDRRVLNSLVFNVFQGPHSRLFRVDSPSGIVRVKKVIDRDVICYKRPTCSIPLDVAIIRPPNYFQVCTPPLMFC